MAVRARSHLVYTHGMLLAVITCVLGIAVETLRWPEDRSAAKQRFVEAERTGEKIALLAGLVLSHSVVRWLIAFAVAATVVRVALEAPGLRAAITAAVESSAMSLLMLDALIGVAIGALMVVLAVAARWIAR